MGVSMHISDQDPNRALEEPEGILRLVDRFISPTLLAEGEPKTTRARILIVQAALVGGISFVILTYQIAFESDLLPEIGIPILVASLSVPIILSHSSSPTWAGGILTGTLFSCLSLANVMTAGREPLSLIFLVTIPMIGTLTQGVRWGAFWTALTLADLFFLRSLAGSTFEAIIPIRQLSTDNEAVSISIFMAVLISITSILHGLMSDYAANRARRSDARLERARARNQEMLDKSPDGLFFATANGRISFVNKTLKRLLVAEPSSDAMLGRDVDDLTRGLDIDQLRNRISDQETSAATECEIQAANGTWIPVEIAISGANEIGGQVCRVRDLRSVYETDREARLMRAIFDGAPVGVGIFEMDTEVVYVNDAYHAFTTFDPSELIGKRLLDLPWAPKSREALGEILSALNNGETVAIPKMRWKQIGDRLSFVDVRAFTIQSPRKERPRWVVFLRDVTNVARLESEVSRSERIDSLGKLAGGIAHDFNNLLTVIMGQVDILEEDLGAEHWAADNLRAIMNACERSSALTSKVLDFSRKQTLRPEVFIAGDAIRDLLPILRQLVPERIGIDVSIEIPGSPRIRCDPTRFEQILLNLVANARDAIDQSGRIAIRVQADPNHDNASQSISEVSIAVSDDGCGMPAQVQDRIFEPFYTTKPMGEGTGLGLSTVHGIAHQSGGRVEVSSREGVGSTLTVFFPETKAELTTHAEVIEEDSLKTRGDKQGTVLIVEDNSAVRLLISTAIERLGFSVVTAENGEEARAYIEESQIDLEALVSDIVIPGPSGIEIARLFRSRFAKKRIILMSGYAEDEIGPRDRLPGDIRFVQKPVSAKEIGRALSS